MATVVLDLAFDNFAFDPFKGDCLLLHSYVGCAITYAVSLLRDESVIASNVDEGVLNNRSGSVPVFRMATTFAPDAHLAKLRSTLIIAGHKIWLGHEGSQSSVFELLEPIKQIIDLRMRPWPRM